MDNKIKPIEDFVHHGLAQRFTTVFGTPLIFSVSTNKKQDAAKRFNGNPKYPLAFASVQSFEITENQYSQITLMRQGVKAQQSADRMLTYKLKPLPVTTTFLITLLCQDLQTATDFAKKWLMAAVRGDLKYSITYGTVDADIHVDLDRNVQIPSRPDNETTTVNELEVTATLRVNGYMSDGIEPVQAAISVDVDGVLLDKPDYDALKQGDRVGVEIFSFRKEWNTTAGPGGSVDDEIK